jgi:hypothetical protein
MRGAETLIFGCKTLALHDRSAYHERSYYKSSPVTVTEWQRRYKSQQSR